jgi:hypothetical protein
MDATGTAVPENQSRGCSQALLYNETRPHQAHGYRTPMAVWHQGLIEIEAGGTATTTTIWYRSLKDGNQAAEISTNKPPQVVHPMGSTSE